jgi:hypothetical protein
MSKKHKHKRIHNPRNSYINNISNVDSLPDNVVISSIQGLCHVCDVGDDKYLMPLLECKNKSIAAVALSALCIHFGMCEKLIDRIVSWASDYGTHDYDYESFDDYAWHWSKLQFSALLELATLAEYDQDMLKLLLSIAEDYHSHKDNSPQASMNCSIWKLLARMSGQKISGDESDALMSYPHSEQSEKIRNRIRNQFKIDNDRPTVSDNTTMRCPRRSK